MNQEQANLTFGLLEVRHTYNPEMAKLFWVRGDPIGFN